MEVQFEEDLTPYSSQSYRPAYGQGGSSYPTPGAPFGYSAGGYGGNPNVSPYMTQRYAGNELDDDPAMIKFLIKHKIFRTQKQARAFLTAVAILCLVLTFALFAWASADPKIVLLNP